MKDGVDSAPFFSSYGNFFLDRDLFCAKIVLIVTLKFLRELFGGMMDKPLQEFKKIGHLIHLMVEREAKKRGLEFSAGPQGQVLGFLSHREKEGKVTLIRDVEQELHISKSVASSLIKRMEKNGFIYLEASPTDKRAKYVYLTDSVKDKLNDMKQFFEEVDQDMMAGVSEEELAIFFKVMHQFYENMKKRSEE